MSKLDESDYDLLYAMFREAMPQVSRDEFPDILSMLIADGVLSISVTENELVVTSLQAPDVGVHRVDRKRNLH
jgi:hypothetical protein